MKFLGLGLLVSLFIAIWAKLEPEGPTRKSTAIKLEWLKTPVGMNITFADKSTDEISFTVDPKDNCLFHGSLKSDIESEVDVDGCTGDLQIVEISSRLVPHGFVVLFFENGETYEIDPAEGIAFSPNLGDIEVPRTEANNEMSSPVWRGPLPTRAVAKIHVRYDNTLLEMVGGQHSAARKKVNRIIERAQRYLKRSKGLAMDVKIEIVSGPNHYSNRITELLLSKLANQGGRGDEHPTAWFIAWKPHTGRMAGISHRPALCQGSAHG